MSSYLERKFRETWERMTDIDKIRYHVYDSSTDIFFYTALFCIFSGFSMAVVWRFMDFFGMLGSFNSIIFIVLSFILIVLTFLTFFVYVYLHNKNKEFFIDKYIIKEKPHQIKFRKKEFKKEEKEHGHIQKKER